MQPSTFWTDRQLQAARDLLKPWVLVVIVHSLSDAYSNPQIHPDYWNTLLRAPIGARIDERNGKLTVATVAEFSHEMKTAGEGLPDDPTLDVICKQSFAYMVHHLYLPV